jgi:hypothetical protein
MVHQQPASWPLMACTAASRWAILVKVDEEPRLRRWLVFSFLADAAAAPFAAVAALVSSLRLHQYVCQEG